MLLESQDIHIKLLSLNTEEYPSHLRGYKNVLSHFIVASDDLVGTGLNTYLTKGATLTWLIQDPSSDDPIPQRLISISSPKMKGSSVTVAMTLPRS